MGVLASEDPGEEGTARQEHVGHKLGVGLPVLAVLLQTAHLVARLSVDDHGGEEGRVEERQGRGETASQAPGGGHNNVTSVLHLASEGIPAADQQVSLGCLDERNGLVEDAPGHLREGPGAAHAHLAGGLLAVGRVENVVTCVHREKREERKQRQGQCK